MRRALLALSLVLMAASVGWMAALLWGRAQEELPTPPPVSEPALASLYATTLPDVAGREQSLRQWRGRILVVNYWATWCVPCRDEMPAFSQLQTRYAARGVQFVGIAADSAEKVAAFARATPISYPLLVGRDEIIKPTRDFGNTPLAVPFTLVLDREGTLRTAVLGRVNEDALVRLLDDLASK